MNCEWQQKIALYVDDELEPAAQQEFAAHLSRCPECPVAVAEQMALKKSVRIAANKFSAPPDLHAAIYRQLHPEPKAKLLWWKLAMPAACLVIIFALGFAFWPRHTSSQGSILASLVDDHVIALSSPNPVDVISESRHTVKPWFQGKLAFTFNPPETAGTNFTLIGGKLVYVNQTAGAQLLYQAGQHKISIFIFSAQTDVKNLHTRSNTTFTVDNWIEGGLQYYLVTDANKEEAGNLVTMFQNANR
jgi:anti-sigma factor RsiW